MPQELDEAQFVDRTKKVVRDASALTKEQDFRDKYSDVSLELRAILRSIKEDEDVKNLQVQTQKFLENFTTTDEQGNKHWDSDFLSQLRTFIVPLLIAQLDRIPIPPVDGSNEDMDYHFEGMVLDGKQVIPDQVDIHTSSDMSLKTNALSASHARSQAFLQINNIKPQVSDVHFKFHRKTFPKISDEGVCNVRVEGDSGISIRIALELLRQGTENLYQFNLTQVNADIDSLKIEIVEAKHDFLLKLFSSVYQQRVKALLERKIEEKIQQLFLRIQEGLNNMLTKYPPSKLKGMVTDKVGALKSKAQDMTSSQQTQGSSSNQPTATTQNQSNTAIQS